MDEMKMESSLGLRNVTEEGGLSTDILYLTDIQRLIFFIIFSIISAVAVAGNIVSICATSRRNYRFFQKASIISLALSDLLMAISYSINNLETFSHPYVNWTLGSFMCSMIPMLQILGLTASTAAIVIIALDRYKNVVHALSNQWNPKPPVCIIGFTIMWLISIGVSYPISEMFSLKQTWIVFLHEDKNPTKERYSFCVSLVKTKLMTYYICMATLIFGTLFLIFVWLYYNIARLVWTHRKPPTGPPVGRNEPSMETSTTHIRSQESHVSRRTTPPMVHGRQYNLHVERKIRTFKIVICLMLVFFVCRIPFWTFNILKLVYSYKRPEHWILSYVFNALALTNCALNPFLYTFLNPTLGVLQRVLDVLADLTCKICCCCFTAEEFEQFERTNPFIIEKCENIAKSPSPRIVGSCRASKVKFGNVVTKQPVSKEVYRSFTNY